MKEKKTLFLHNGEIKAYNVRKEQLHGHQYTVVPVVMMMEGVHHGSGGPLYYSAEELQEAIPTWDAIPVTVGHPTDGNGYVAASNPVVMQEWAVGTVFYCHMDGIKLRAEAWIRDDLANTVHPPLLGLLEQGEAMEVSVGVFCQADKIGGMYNNEAYVGSVHSIRPDHLALLPTEQGACSVADGCGIRINKEQDNIKQKQKSMEITVNEKMRALNKEGFAVHEVVVSSKSLSAVMDSVRALVYSADSETASYYVEEVYDDYVIYNRRMAGTIAYFKRLYAITSDGSAIWTGDAVEVIRRIAYTPVAGEEVNNTATVPDESTVRMVDELIAHGATRYTEENREWLQTLDAMVLPTLFPLVHKKNVPPTGVTVYSSMDDLLEAATDDLRAQIREGLEFQQAKRKEICAHILRNTKDGTWTEQALAALPCAVLERVYNTLPVAEEGSTLFTGNVGADVTKRVQSNTEVEPLLPLENINHKI